MTGRRGQAGALPLKNLIKLRRRDRPRWRYRKRGSPGIAERYAETQGTKYPGALAGLSPQFPLTPTTSYAVSNLRL